MRVDRARASERAGERADERAHVKADGRRLIVAYVLAADVDLSPLFGASVGRCVVRTKILECTRKRRLRAPRRAHATATTATTATATLKRALICSLTLRRVAVFVACARALVVFFCFLFFLFLSFDGNPHLSCSTRFIAIKYVSYYGCKSSFRLSLVRLRPPLFASTRHTNRRSSRGRTLGDDARDRDMVMAGFMRGGATAYEAYGLTASPNEEWPTLSLSAAVSSHRSGGRAAPMPPPLQQQQQQLQQSAPSQPPPPIVSSPTSAAATTTNTPKNPKLYKTELCRSWMDSGRCNYGERYARLFHIFNARLRDYSRLTDVNMRTVKLKSGRFHDTRNTKVSNASATINTAIATMAVDVILSTLNVKQR